MQADQADIYLASNSPRRSALLGQAGIAFRQLQVDVDESRRSDEESPEVYVLRLALEKARAGWQQVAGSAPLPVLGADTVVAVDDVLYGKPRDRADAIAMLEELSGATHRVLTGVALVDDREATRLSYSSVTFRELTRQEIERYWDSGEPVDKAGAYAIQGRGAVFIEHLEGSYSGVMGLPLFEVADLMEEFDIDFRHRW
ncbi:septum formation protein [Natronocella acetinitrilica]|uniref:dTTP/UTP pyrophosphatase n=1 Tax=Natronocella acetinitrilica TaxID=414046 RepID=A0AAE3G1J8_9GAMM|nr:Maf family protein [Natronocella acetinitrilica]MCP1673905.1 septum formation protein [Natronocella acetinitrilica]